MKRENNRNYKEVSLEKECSNYQGTPLAKAFRYEYALYRVISGMFAKTVTMSRVFDNLEMYFCELPNRPANIFEEAADSVTATERKKRTQEDILDEVSALVRKHVAGKVNFPMPEKCAVCVYSNLEEDGTHTLIFSDGIYGFSVHVDVSKKGHAKSIKVKDLSLLSVGGKPEANRLKSVCGGKKDEPVCYRSSHKETA